MRFRRGTFTRGTFTRGTFTYWGATGDFNLAESGRSAIDVYKVTLPAPPRPG